MDKIIDILVNFYGPTHYLFIFGILVLCGLGLFIPEDVILFAAGLSAYFGFTHLSLMIVVSYFGVMVGDSIIFYLGAKYGRKLAKRWFFRKVLTNERLNSVQAQFHKKGNKLIFIARFMPGLRAPIYFSAGTLHLPYRIFLFYDGLAAVLSVPTIIGAVYFFGDPVFHVIQKIEHWISFVIAIVIFTILAKWYMSRRREKRSP